MIEPSGNTGRSQIVGLVLAGGLARRMGGGDKVLLALGGRVVLDHILERLRPQVTGFAINANGDASRFSRFNAPVVPDTVDGHAGPLAGVLAGMQWATVAYPAARYIATVAGDSPFFPAELVRRLAEAALNAGNGTAIALASTEGRLHPVFGLWPIALCGALEQFLRGESERRVLAFADRYQPISVPFEAFEAAGRPIDPFFNLNTPQDLAEAEAVVAAITKDRVP